MFARTFIAIAALVAAASATTVNLTNSCGYQVDPGFYPAATASDGSSTGGFAVAAGSSSSVSLDSTWSGRIWGRTGCDASGNCQTGGCGSESCTSPAGSGVTLAQFSINSWDSLDFFTPSTTDGFNIAVTITPGSGCTTSPVACTGQDMGNGCNATNSCPTGTNYTISFC
ncbi:Osmotin, thaumatin-like protein [Daedalea quercina L-15889]|uniref:Osmotin, thaumatin-like protein n=1 Tax=Daedalea quercina L-15889 TaxID=1314783 RepID=A0A165M5F3_9APHY|nr:Osmotin, thaumatin-like protein [Daedalea quercina L-15889]